MGSHDYFVDGPALRSTAIISYANWLLDNSNTTYVTQTLWPIIKLDLDYVANNWNQSTYVFYLSAIMEYRLSLHLPSIASIYGRRSTRRRSSPPPSNTARFVRVRPSLLALARLRLWPGTPPRPTIFSASSRSVAGFRFCTFMQYANIFSLISRTGTPAPVTLLPTLVAAAPARTPTPFSRLSTPSTRLQDVTPRRSSPARTRRSPT